MPPELDSDLLQLLAAPPPALTAARAEHIARESFGIIGSAVALPSERDQNFCIQSTAGPCYLLRIANPLEPLDVTDFQTQALLHIARRDPDLPTPRVCRTIDGATHAIVETDAQQPCTVRLLTYLPGTPLGQRTATARLRKQLGSCMARLGKALRDFSHPAARHPLLWDMNRAASLRQLVEYVSDPDHQALVGRTLRRFEQVVQPRLTDLRWQVIHSDLNPSNLLVADHDPELLRGIIDFGDLVSCPLVVDVAVAAAYQLRHTPDPIDAVLELATAYHRICPLEPSEIDLLVDLIATRLASAVLITAWHATIQPHNRDYILRNCSTHCQMLEQFERMPGDQLHGRFRNACHSSMQ